MSPSQAAAPGMLAPVLERLKTVPRTALLMGGAALIALLVAVTLWCREPQYKVLFANLGERDGGAIMAALNQMNVPYRFQDGSAALLVPADRVHETRLSLAAQGLPRGGSVGFELLDEGKFGASQFTEQVNFQRALEGELARSIEAVQVVQSARVHLAIPRQSMFLRNRQEPTASVLLNLYPGRVMDDHQVAAIAHLVSSSVPELSVQNISVIDQHGRLLSLPGGEGRGMDAGQFQHLRDIEQTYAQRIEAILTPLLGPGNARAQVSAEVDFSRREETQEVYRPNEEPGQAAIRSRQTSDMVQQGAGLAQGIPGALSNQPPLDPVAPLVETEAPPEAATPPANAVAPPPLNERHEATTNYEVDRTITHLQHAVGTIARLSVAVIINHVPDTEGLPQPLPPERLDQLRNLVKEAMGYSEARGDSLQLVHSEFARTPELQVIWWRDPYNVALAKTAGGWLLGLLLATWLWFGVLRPLLRRQFETAGKRGQPAAEAADAQGREAAASEASAARVRQQSRYEENLQTARELAMKDPRAVAAVIRSWMEKDG